MKRSKILSIYWASPNMRKLEYKSLVEWMRDLLKEKVRR